MNKLIHLDIIPSHLHQVMNEEGILVKNYQPKLSPEQIVETYKKMVVGREVDKKMLQWQRIGKMLTFAPNLGEEALQFGCALAMDKTRDWLVPAFRSFHLMSELGVEIWQLLLYWNGNEKGSKFFDNVNVLPINITIGAQMSQAAGIGYAFSLKKQKNVAVTFIGDGGTSEGEFYESMNLAAIYNWPVVFCINNNQWSISTPRDKESKVVDLSIKAIAAGVHRARVDGNDLLASYDVMLEAMDHARSGKGPVLVEFVTYRKGPHTTSDDPSIYRTKEEEERWEKKDPIDRLYKYLVSQSLWSKEDEEKLNEYSKTFIQEQYDQMVLMNNTSIDDIFNHTYETLPDDLQEQKKIAKKYFE
ncbi:MAG: pyruvate dehydrogenase (acetyl-transferring) E1 component subunit alpha [Mycoplasmoidaceae bacterium]